MDWKDIWKLPLKYDYGYAWGDNDTMALTMYDDEEDDAFLSDIVAAINGEREFTRGGHWTANTCDIYCDGKYICCARGWGELTSPACLGLSYEDASAVQNEFVKYILSKLNKDEI